MDTVPVDYLVDRCHAPEVGPLLLILVNWVKLENHGVHIWTRDEWEDVDFYDIVQDFNILKQEHKIYETRHYTPSKTLPSAMGSVIIQLEIVINRYSRKSDSGVSTKWICTF